MRRPQRVVQPHEPVDRHGDHQPAGRVHDDVKGKHPEPADPVRLIGHVFLAADVRHPIRAAADVEDECVGQREAGHVDVGRGFVHGLALQGQVGQDVTGAADQEQDGRDEGLELFLDLVLGRHVPVLLELQRERRVVKASHHHDDDEDRTAAVIYTHAHTHTNGSVLSFF